MHLEGIHQYLQKEVNPTIQRLMVHVIKQKPKHVANFCKVWFERQLQIQKQLANSDEESDQDPILTTSIQQKKSQLKWYQPRIAVCGQVYGNYNKRPQIQLKSIKKKSALTNKILFHLKSLFLFRDLDDADLSTLINTMEQQKYNHNTIIFKDAQQSNSIYVVDEGQLQCYKVFNDHQIHIKFIKEGQCFGQLSLMYNTPLSYNIRVKNKATLYKLNRNVFKSVVCDQKLKRRKTYCQVLQKVELFRDLEKQERYQIEDVLQEMLVHPNQYIIREGKFGNKFYIIQEGKLVALKKQPNGHQKMVYHYKQGDYFGELALLQKKPRQASIMSLTHCKLLFIEREAFQRVIGPLQKILKRSSQIYQKYKEI